jgi:hypothetical protein
MRRPLLGLLLAPTFLVAASLPARAARAEPPPAPLAPYAAPATAPPWAAPLAGTRRRSTGAMAGGIVLTSLGAIGMAVGTASYVDTVSGCQSMVTGNDLPAASCNNGATKAFAMTMLLVSATAVGFGVPLWIYGAEKVAVTSEDQAPRPAAASVVIGPGAAALHVTF